MSFESGLDEENDVNMANMIVWDNIESVFAQSTDNAPQDQSSFSLAAATISSISTSTQQEEVRRSEG